MAFSEYRFRLFINPKVAGSRVYSYVASLIVFGPGGGARTADRHNIGHVTRPPSVALRVGTLQGEPGRRRRRPALRRHFALRRGGQRPNAPFASQLVHHQDGHKPFYQPYQEAQHRRAQRSRQGLVASQGSGRWHRRQRQ